ncbi:FKBP-type peptidyl-prolyl cis-trans isomerase [Methylotenera sp.]|uniref:FKBP-type peptidyl-prolyl cis-trans isomerase n=1 Tax=Methylotenera sp. TaxID=2051956 RepID=UPI00271DAB1F|nr:FKBP-type peptidyl-prolyl cis-trans isomerase [Methylotenera sp.]MDO9205569.1 FKBP-type peptidyl-prolyl cis-trans isomerase [Methylotenera sp.]MDP2070091.1 FKBP-type peptidyl-prolyl cis-trans isomerase [Methylotenera sp.]MDP2229985.1 FKBP-type peptidyl-prolyl cis-trans isomerase [Methylotenera sp.]MDP3006456.1 FKBP-type peptidyl-prolyl cis-trans isomerase [Methylotenera sp.]MDP3140548.1 FKBP-type peptidyl-prolyl cis-trans isomerase [Methylotenera sp.]
MKLFNVLLASGLAFSLNACNAEIPKSKQETPAKETTAMTAEITELQKIDTQVGAGREAEPGFNVKVHYTGWLFDAAAKDNKGKKFDSSLDRGQPFEFGLGQGQVIQGWDEGFAGMKVGGKRTLIIPSEMGYGARGAGGAIPPNATLIFDVELLDVK